MGFKRPGVQIAPLGPSHRAKKLSSFWVFWLFSSCGNSAQNRSRKGRNRALFHSAFHSKMRQTRVEIRRLKMRKSENLGFPEFFPHVYVGKTAKPGFLIIFCEQKFFTRLHTVFCVYDVYFSAQHKYVVENKTAGNAIMRKLCRMSSSWKTPQKTASFAPQNTKNTRPGDPRAGCFYSSSSGPYVGSSCLPLLY